jgi:hypothetical protein
LNVDKQYQNVQQMILIHVKQCTITLPLARLSA